MSTVIKVENLSKQYRLGDVGTGSISHDVNRAWHKLRGKEDPYLKIGENNDRTQKGNSDYVWALKDINFEVKQGEVLGIIGRNGAGKSTLLKILSRTTTPTTGSVKLKGRVASLLEVGTGFHPELSGRENIFLNGAIMGMSKQEIKRKFDEIVDFAGVERYIDTPVKRYSSGMYVRLAFGVAAHLEPEILIVDEVLAVGDAEFQNKAIGKMKEISEGQGRTVIFVSHNLASIHKLCNEGLLMNEGRIEKVGNIEEILDKYSALGNRSSGTATISRDHEIVVGKKLLITKLSVTDINYKIQNEFTSKEPFFIKIEFDILIEGIGYNMGIELWNNKNECVFTTKLFDSKPDDISKLLWKKGQYTYFIKMPIELLKEGNYFVRSAAAIPLEEMLDLFPLDIEFKFNDFTSLLFKTGEGRNGLIIPVLNWEHND